MLSSDLCAIALLLEPAPTSASAPKPSRGSGEALLHHIKGVACLGAPADLLAGAAAPEALFERCRAVGVIRSCDHPEDVKAWAQELSDLSPLDAASALRPRPLLVMHGADDQEVPIAAARALAEAAAPYSDLRLVFGAGHWLRADPRVVATLMGWLERQRSPETGGSLRDRRWRFARSARR